MLNKHIIMLNETNTGYISSSVNVDTYQVLLKSVFKYLKKRRRHTLSYIYNNTFFNRLNKHIIMLNETNKGYISSYVYVDTYQYF